MFSITSSSAKYANSLFTINSHEFLVKDEKEICIRAFFHSSGTFYREIFASEFLSQNYGV